MRVFGDTPGMLAQALMILAAPVKANIIHYQINVAAARVGNGHGQGYWDNTCRPQCK